MNSFLDTLGIATTEGAIDRDMLNSLCRRDPTLITHAHSRQRHADYLQRKAEQAAALEQRRVESAENAARQREDDIANVARIMAVYATDIAAQRTEDVQAQWKKTTIEKLKSFYRLHVPVTERPQHQPTTKANWIDFVAPRIRSVYDELLLQNNDMGGAIDMEI